MQITKHYAILIKIKKINMLKDLVAYQKLYDLIVYMYPIINKFPKEQRFVLGQRFENKLFDILNIIIEANLCNGPRDKYYKQMSLEFDVLFHYIRLSKDLVFISIRQYLQISEKTNEVAMICDN